MAYMSVAWLGSHKTVDAPFPSSASQWHAVSQDATFPPPNISKYHSYSYSLFCKGKNDDPESN